MDDQSTAAPAGDSAQPVSDNSPLSLDDAVVLLGPDKPEKEDPAPGKPAEAPDEPETEEEPASDAEPAAGEADPDAEAPEEPETEPEAEYAHGNLKVRLRDGTEMTVADLKKGRERVQELERQVAETEARVRKEIEPTLSQAQQKQKVLDELLPIAIQAMQSQIPPMPDSSLRETDPLEYHNRKDMHLEAVAKFRDLKGQLDQQTAEQQQAHAQAFQGYVKEQQTQLLKARPDLKDPQKAQAFYGTFIEAAMALGVSKEEADNVHDHRIVLGVTQLYEKAKRWDALQAKRPVVVEKQKDAVPVQAPTRRASPGERKDAQVEVLDKKLSRTGSLDDAVALLNLIN